MYGRLSMIAALGMFALGVAAAQDDDGGGEGEPPTLERPAPREADEPRTTPGVEGLDRPLPLLTDKPVPRRGARMETVRQQFGDPERHRPPVGDPPITRWEYADFIVYFEHRRVIHSVVIGDSDQGGGD